MMNRTSLVFEKSRSQSLDFVISVIQVLGFAGLTALCADARIYLSFSPVPITLQSLAVILSGAILGSKKGALSQIVLILAGAAGLSVFSQGGPQSMPGYLALVGPTGGYILGFVFAAYVAGLMKERNNLRGFVRSSLYLFTASLFILVPGVIWLKVFTHTTFTQAILLGFLPYLLGDLLKTFAAALFLSGKNFLGR